MNIFAVIVTYNRLELLKKSLSCYENQTKYPHAIVIVNNNSSDGTQEFLKEWQQNSFSKFQRIIINLPTNIGGSGGFFEGTKYAVEHGADWIWVADDDAFPYSTAFENFEIFVRKQNNKIAAVCGCVISNGIISTGHRGKIEKKLFIYKPKCITTDNYNKPYFEIDIFTYVGAILNANALKEYGHINKDFFIYNDDSEHALRLKKYGKILCVPSIKIIHNATLSSRNSTLTWKKYYLVRNNLYLSKFHYGFLTFHYWLFRAIIKSLVSDKETKKMYRKIIHDVKDGRMGIDSIYKPGWKSGN